MITWKVILKAAKLITFHSDNLYKDNATSTLEGAEKFYFVKAYFGLIVETSTSMKGTYTSVVWRCYVGKDLAIPTE